MKVLISAFVCDPKWGSEPGAGWAWTRGAAERHDVWLITDARNRAAIEQALSADPAPHLHPVYLALPRWTGGPWRAAGAGLRNRYLVWQCQVRPVVRRLHASVGFDVAHHLTLSNDWLPIGLTALRDVPLVWGPVGGVAGTPPAMWRWIGWRAGVSEVSRSLVTTMGRRAFGDRTARRAALVVAQTAEEARRFSRVAATVVEPNIALVRVPEADAAARGLVLAPDRPTVRRAVFAGRLLPSKGLSLAVSALARPEASGWVLDVYGEGSTEAGNRRLAGSFGLGDRVRFHGHVDRADLLSTLAEADALLFPSMHDAAGWAVAEALAAGCPVVCLDLGGPAVLVTEAGGTPVPVSGDVVGALAAGLRDIGGRLAPVRRWDAERIPEVSDLWYRWATERQSFPLAGVET